MSFASDLVSIVISLVLVMFSATLHEVAHGYAAYKLGDPTAKMAGRLTLNPKAHLDPVGSVVLPLMMAIAGGPIFAFAKPVPYNPNNLRNPRRDELLVALAGPASNLAQALLGALAFNLAFDPIANAYGAGSMSYEVATGILMVLSTYVMVNVMLMCFNLIPLPPLDGSKVILFFMHGKARETYYRWQGYSMTILLVAMSLLPQYFGIDPIGWLLDRTAYPLYQLLLGV